MSDYIQQVAKQAQGRWKHVLSANGISVPDNSQKHAPCPACGGSDRFRFDDKEGRGTWICNQCEPRAGDGLALIQNVKRCSTMEAAKLVADTLGEQLPLSDRNNRIHASQKEISIEHTVKALLNQTTQANHSYLQNKGYKTELVAVLPDGKAIIPLVTLKGEFRGAQTITPKGVKRLISGTKKMGAFALIETEKFDLSTELFRLINCVIITEGYATALAIKSISDNQTLVLAAIDAGNLINVANVIRQAMPEVKIIIGADNDVTQDGSRNVGKEEAEKAAYSVHGWVALPPTSTKADWDDYRQQNGTESTQAAFYASLYQVQGKTLTNPVSPPNSANQNLSNNEPKKALPLSQMGASQRGEVLLNRYGGDLALEELTEVAHFYNGVTWKPITDRELMREMVAVFIEADEPYTSKGAQSAVDALKLQLPLMSKPTRNIIGFKNGVFDLEKGEFRAHDRNDWLVVSNDITFTHAEAGETLATHAPNFWQWINRAASKDTRKVERILAALFMVLANRYDWQLFLEITGAGGSGKSVLSDIFTLLAGKGNTVSANMAALENPRERALVVGYSLIIMPDQTRYVGDGSGLKAITGGDEVAIDPKHKQPYSTRIQAVVIAVNNNAMSFSDRSGGISRRRVIFNFSEVIPEKERDPLLRDKIANELPVIIRHLLTRFNQASDAKALLIEQQLSEEALDIKRGTDSLVDFCGYLFASMDCEGMLIGNAEIIPFNPKRYLYHAYLAFMRGNNLAKPVSLTRFGIDIKGALAEHSKEYLRKRTTAGIRTNLNLDTENANDWLPKAGDN